jgi:hypothetical protein
MVDNDAAQMRAEVQAYKVIGSLIMIALLPMSFPDIQAFDMLGLCCREPWLPLNKKQRPQLPPLQKQGLRLRRSRMLCRYATTPSVNYTAVWQQQCSKTCYGLIDSLPGMYASPFKWMCLIKCLEAIDFVPKAGAAQWRVARKHIALWLSSLCGAPTCVDLAVRLHLERFASHCHIAMQAEQRKKTMRRQMSTALLRKPDGTSAEDGLYGEPGDEDMEALGRRLAAAQEEIHRLAGQLQQANAKRAELAQVGNTSVVS